MPCMQGTHADLSLQVDVMGGGYNVAWMGTQERKGGVRQRMREQGVLSGGGAEKKPPTAIPEDVPRALHRFFKKGTQ